MSTPAGHGDEVAYLGHATTLVDLGGTRLLTDPVLRPRIAHISRRVDLPQAADLEELDGILISHAHMDHLDVASLRRVAGDGPVVVPRGLGAGLRRRGIAVTHELEAGERVRIGALEVQAVHAEHDGRRYPGGRRFPALGYVIDGPWRVYFAGDTDLFDAMRELHDIDLALIPIGGWGTRLGPGHLDPQRAAEAVARISPRVAVPIHWGTLASPALAQTDLAAPARGFAQLVAQAAPGVDVVVLAPGERHALGAVRQAR